MDCKQAVSLMHDLLDDDLERSCATELKEHMLACPACHEQFRQLESTERLLYGFNHRLQSPANDLTDRVMAVIPKPKKQNTLFIWAKRHPAITVAAVFVIVMMSSALSMWNSDQQLQVKGALDGVIIEDNKVIVPTGIVVKGDLTIHNGQAEVYGDVEGNLTVIDGKLFQASTAHITGSVQEIDEALDWMWYQISSLFDGGSVSP